MNPWIAIKGKLDEWGDALERRIIARVLDIVADVLAAEPTTPTVLRAKAQAMREGK